MRKHANPQELAWDRHSPDIQIQCHLVARWSYQTEIEEYAFTNDFKVKPVTQKGTPMVLLTTGDHRIRIPD